MLWMWEVADGVWGVCWFSAALVIPRIVSDACLGVEACHELSFPAHLIQPDQVQTHFPL